MTSHVTSLALCKSDGLISSYCQISLLLSYLKGLELILSLVDLILVYLS